MQNAPGGRGGPRWAEAGQCGGTDPLQQRQTGPGATRGGSSLGPATLPPAHSQTHSLLCTWPPDPRVSPGLGDKRVIQAWGPLGTTTPPASARSLPRLLPSPPAPKAKISSFSSGPARSQLPSRPSDSSSAPAQKPRKPFSGLKWHLAAATWVGGSHSQARLCASGRRTSQPQQVSGARPPPCAPPPPPAAAHRHVRARSSEHLPHPPPSPRPPPPAQLSKSPFRVPSPKPPPSALPTS